MESSKELFNKKIKERGITLVALVVTIIILLILAGVTIGSITSNGGLLSRTKQAKESYEKGQANEISDLEKMTIELDETTNNYNENKKVNAPQIKTGMTPIKFTEAVGTGTTSPTTTTYGVQVKTTSEDEAWYNYDNKHWANAQTEDGSMWVWIPRYAYKINTSNQTTDVVFLIGKTDNYYDENGNIKTAKRCNSADEVVDTTTGYTVHPAFTNESNISYRNGGWDSELTGIWMSKFEAGYVGSNGANTAPVKASSTNYTQTRVYAPMIEIKGEDASAIEYISARNWLDGVYSGTTTAIKYPTFQGSTYSMNYINAREAYSISKVLTENGNIYGLSTDTDSHLMKNSEWGAISYLSKSKYGLLTTDIAVNSHNENNGGVSTTEAQGNTKASVYGVTGYNNNENTWNSYLGTNLSASTTGNIYGIYDLSGGESERTSAYIANNNGNLVYGSSFTNYTNSSTEYQTKSTKYATVYPSNDSGESDIYAASKKNYGLDALIYGDAVRETSTAGIGVNSWYSDYSYFPALWHSFFGRGSSFSGGISAGLYSFFDSYADSGYTNGFRAVLI